MSHLGACKVALLRIALQHSRSAIIRAAQGVMLDIVSMLFTLLRTYIPAEIRWSYFLDLYDMFAWNICMSVLLYCVFFALWCAMSGYVRTGGLSVFQPYYFERALHFLRKYPTKKQPKTPPEVFFWLFFW